MRFFASGYAIKIELIESSGVLGHKDAVFIDLVSERKDLGYK